MLEIKLLIDDIDYLTTVRALAPLIFKSGIKSRAAMLAVNARLKNKPEGEQAEIASEFINSHTEKILLTVNSELRDHGATATVKHLNAEKI